MKAKVRSLGFAILYAAVVVFLAFVAVQWAQDARGAEVVGPLFIAAGAGLAVARCQEEWKASRRSRR